MSGGEVFKFKYPEVISDHNRYRGGGVNNNFRYRGIKQSQFTGHDVSTKSKIGLGGA